MNSAPAIRAAGAVVLVLGFYGLAHPAAAVEPAPSPSPRQSATTRSVKDPNQKVESNKVKRLPAKRRAAPSPPAAAEAAPAVPPTSQPIDLGCMSSE